MQHLKSLLTSNNMQYQLKRGQDRIKGGFLSLLSAVIITGICFIVLGPVFGIISKAFMPIGDFYSPLVYLIPENPTLTNIITAAENIKYTSSLTYTLILCIGAMLIQVFICAMVGYGFARFKFYGNTLLFGMVVLTIVIPVQTLMVPMYNQFRYFDLFGIMKLSTGTDTGLNLINTPWPTLLMTISGMGLRSGLYVYIFRQFFKGLPKEIEEAACIDGTGPFHTFIRIMLPNATSAIIIVMLFSFVWQYNDTFFAGLFMSETNMLSLKLTSLNSVLTMVLNIRDKNLVNLIVNAGVMLAIVPLLIVYLFLQRYFMEGIERSGIVG